MKNENDILYSFLYDGESLSVEEFADVMMSCDQSYSKDEALEIAKGLYFIRDNLTTSFQGSIFTKAFGLDVY